MYTASSAVSHQDRLGAQRLLVGEQRAGKKALDRGRRAQPFLHLADARAVASLKDTSGARLNDTVTEGNKPV